MRPPRRAARDPLPRALLRETTLPPRDIVQKALTIAGEICIYTNTNITVLEPAP